MSILTGAEIRKHIETGDIQIEGYNPKRVNQTSYDVTLGREVAVYDDATFTDAADEWERLTRPGSTEAGMGARQATGFGVGPYDGRGLARNQMILSGPNTIALDSKERLRLRKWEMDPEAGWIIMPGVGYLMHTAERVTTRRFNPVLDGKSSIGRLFIQVHVTAGYGEPHFDGQWTLEVTSMFPIRVYPGMRIGQLRFMTVTGEIEPYTERGHYTGSDAQGTVGSKAFKSAFD